MMPAAITAATQLAASGGGETDQQMLAPRRRLGSMRGTSVTTPSSL
jgi:hypothetical protein